MQLFMSLEQKHYMTAEMEKIKKSKQSCELLRSYNTRTALMQTRKRGNGTVKTGWDCARVFIE
jgi:hypothetical protein